MRREPVGCWVGVDWGDKEHTVCVVGADGVEVTQFTVRQEASALQGLAERLRELGPVAGVAVETPRHLLVHVLVEGRFAVYPINPRVSHAWRQCSSVGGAKDDRRDAWVLADGLRHHHAKLRAFVPERGPARVLGLLCEDECRLIGQRTAPVTVQSATHRSVHIRRACRKDARCTLHHFAGQSLNQSVWAKAVYSRARQRGQKHATALRFVANKWLKIIYRMWQTGEPYDEQRYLRQLIKKKSPIAYDLGLLKT